MCRGIVDLAAAELVAVVEDALIVEDLEDGEQTASVIVVCNAPAVVDLSCDVVHGVPRDHVLLV